VAELHFGTDGWRAIIGEGFTFHNVRRIGQALADYLLENDANIRGVCVGYDTRFLSGQFALTIAEVVASNRIPVWLSQGYIPTPVVAFTVKNQQLNAGIMITASHNPSYYNGIKFKANYGGPASVTTTKTIEKYVGKSTIRHDLKIAREYLQFADFFLVYREHLCKWLNIELLRRFRMPVVVDPLHGAGCRYLSSLLQTIPLSVHSINNHPDPLFGGLTPEPIAKNLSGLKRAVIRHKAAVGLALDGDGDRFGVMDEEGRFVELHDLLPLLFRHLVHSRQWSGDVVRTTSLADTIDRVAEEFQRKCDEVPVGFKNVTEVMLKKDILIGGEESGGFGYKNHLPERDGLLSCLLVLEMLVREDHSLKDLVAELRRRYGPFHYLRKDVYADAKLLCTNFERLRQNPPQKIGRLKVNKTDLNDGIKFYFPARTWLLIRLSRTEPMVRFYVGGSDAKVVRHLLRGGMDLVLPEKT